jgi:hypothetical protein
MELVTISQGVSLINGLRQLRPAGKRALKQREAVVQILRSIYFTPRGTRAILETLAAGNMPDQEDIESILPDFNDSEWQIRRLIDDMRFENRDFEEIGLANRRTLEQVAYGKVSLRRDLQDALNPALTNSGSVPPEVAASLLARVNDLNRMIEDLEREFL